MEFLLVSGLPRSGTSLMMQLLHAGGIPVMHDGIRAADDDNREGYWEWEEIKQLRSHPRLIEQARGKAVKVVSALLGHLPPRHRYRIVFMRRPIGEIVDSQWKMLANRGTVPRSDRDHLAAAQEKHLAAVLRSLRESPRVDLLEVDYPDLVHRPADVLPRLATFLGPVLQADLPTLAAVIQPRLHRHRLIPEAS
jgi:hypothetical protein